MPASTRWTRSPLAALLTDEFRRGAWKLVWAQMAALGTAAIVYASLRHAGPLDLSAGRSLHFVLLWITFATTAAAARSAGGDPSRLYLLPLSHWQIAAHTLFPGMICVGTTYLATAGALNVAFGAGWPILGPALFLPAVMGMMTALSLAAGPSHVHRLTSWCLAAIWLEGSLRRSYGGGSFLEPGSLWNHVSIGELTSISLTGVSAFLLAAYSIARHRRGDRAVLSTLAWRPIFAPRERQTPRQPFRDAGQAQFWFEWRQKGLILPSLFLVVAVLLLTAYFLKSFDRGTYELMYGSFGFGKGIGPIALIVGLVIGHLDPTGANPECGSFLATRPATSAQLSGAVLKAAAASLMATWLAWCAAMIITSALVDLERGHEPVLDLWTNHGMYSSALAVLGYFFPLVLFAVVLLEAWIVLSLAISLVLTGRQRLLVCVVAGGVPVFLLGLFLAARSAEGQPVWSDGVGQSLAGVAALGGTAWAWLGAFRRGHVGATSASLALSAWFGLCAVVVGLYILTGPLELSHLIMTAGALALPIAPFAAAPLALAWNRHR